MVDIMADIDRSVAELQSRMKGGPEDSTKGGEEWMYELDTKKGLGSSFRSSCVSLASACTGHTNMSTRVQKSHQSESIFSSSSLGDNLRDTAGQRSLSVNYRGSCDVNDLSSSTVTTASRTSPSRKSDIAGSPTTITATMEVDTAMRGFREGPDTDPPLSDASRRRLACCMLVLVFIASATAFVLFVVLADF